MLAHLLYSPARIEDAPLKLEEIPVPAPSAGEVLIKVTVCGVCRTDLHIVEGELVPPSYPVVPGHQCVGHVFAKGRGCKRFDVGDRIGIAWLRGTCKTCWFCSNGQENLCAGSLYSGFHAHGGYTEYAVIDENYAYRLPEGYSDQEAAPLLCAGIIGYRALKRSQLPDKGKLLIYGFGSSAHITCQIALGRGAQVFVATRAAKHRALAKELGAAWCGDAFDLPPERVDSAIIFAPIGDLVPAALSALRPGGTVALAGIHMSDIPALNYQKHIFHEKTLQSVEANTRADGTEFLAEASKVGVKVSVLPFDFKDANQALLKLKNDAFEGSAVLVH